MMLVGETGVLKFIREELPTMADHATEDVQGRFRVAQLIVSYMTVLVG